LEVEDCAALSSKERGEHGQDIGELWHRRLGHLHHGALKIMQQISTGLPKGTLEQVSTCKGCTLGKYAKSIPFMIGDGRAGAFWREFIQMCVDLLYSLHQKNIGIMLFLLMIFLVNVGSTSCRRRIKLLKVL
jgi:hypothetical protein